LAIDKNKKSRPGQGQSGTQKYLSKQIQA